VRSPIATERNRIGSACLAADSGDTMVVSWGSSLEAAIGVLCCVLSPKYRGNHALRCRRLRRS
jgi:hypothetical protein